MLRSVSREPLLQVNIIYLSHINVLSTSSKAVYVDGQLEFDD